MAFRVQELTVAVDPVRIACGATEAQCPTASAMAPPTPESKRNLELLRRIITGREH